MNILIEGGDLNPPFAEGTRNVVITHAKALIKRGHKAVILTRNKSRIDGKKLDKHETIQGIRFYRWSNYLELLFLYRKIIQKENIDLVHFFAKGGRPVSYLKILKAIKKKPFIFSLLGLPAYPSAKKRRNVVINSLNSVNLGVITSNAVLKELKSEIKNAAYVPFGIDLKKYNFKKQSRKYILALRSPTKELIVAFKRLKKEFPSFKFVFNSATLDENDNLREEVRKNFEILGKNENMPLVFQKTLILVDLHEPTFPLKCASPPVAIIEALSCGAKIVSTSMPEIKEIITEKTGYLLKKNESEEIYQTLKKIIVLKPKTDEKAIKQVLSNYDINKVIKIYEQIYKKLVNSC